MNTSTSPRAAHTYRSLFVSWTLKKNVILLDFISLLSLIMEYFFGWCFTHPTNSPVYLSRYYSLVVVSVLNLLIELNWTMRDNAISVIFRPFFNTFFKVILCSVAVDICILEKNNNNNLTDKKTSLHRLLFVNLYPTRYLHSEKPKEFPHCEFLKFWSFFFLFFFGLIRLVERQFKNSQFLCVVCVCRLIFLYLLSFIIRL